MTKLDGTAGQFFSVIADAINLRGTARSGKGSGAQANGSAGFRDLLHKVSNPARGCLDKHTLQAAQLLVIGIAHVDAVQVADRSLDFRGVQITE